MTDSWFVKGGHGQEGFKTPTFAIAGPQKLATAEPKGSPGEGVSQSFRAGTLGTAQKSLATAAIRGQELGEPTSFKGGAGAPEPITVMRGTTQTYQSPFKAAGQDTFGLPEYATPTQAKQATNKALSDQQQTQEKAAANARGLTDPNIESRAAEEYGVFRAPGQTQQEIASLKEGEGQKQERFLKSQWYQSQIDDIHKKAQTAQEAENGKSMLNWLVDQGHVGMDEKGNPIQPTDKFMQLAQKRAMHIAAKQGLEAGQKDFRESLTFQRYEPYMTPEMFGVSPEEFNMVRSNPEAWRAKVIQMAPHIQQRLQTKAQEERTSGFPSAFRLPMMP